MYYKAQPYFVLADIDLACISLALLGYYASLRLRN